MLGMLPGDASCVSLPGSQMKVADRLSAVKPRQRCVTYGGLAAHRGSPGGGAACNFSCVADPMAVGLSPSLSSSHACRRSRPRRQPDPIGFMRSSTTSLSTRNSSARHHLRWLQHLIKPARLTRQELPPVGQGGPSRPLLRDGNWNSLRVFANGAHIITAPLRKFLGFAGPTSPPLQATPRRSDPECKTTRYK
jgi:hypothetical protein